MKPSRFIYTAHAVGVSAQFTRIEANRNLDLQLTAQASCALPITGGIARAEVKRFKLPFEAKDRKYLMISGESAATECIGVAKKNGVETTASTQVIGYTACEKRLVIG